MMYEIRGVLDVTQIGHAFYIQSLVIVYDLPLDTTVLDNIGCKCL